MKVELNLDLKQSGDLMNDVLESLTKDDKRSIGLELVKHWFDEGVNVEKEAYKEKIIRKLMSENDSWGNVKCKSREDAIGSFDFRNEMKRFVPIKHQMVNAMLESIKNDVTYKIGEHFRGHEVVNKYINNAVEVIKESLPDMVVDAITGWILTSFHNMANTFQTDTNTEMIKQIKDKLGMDY